jgi:hypothetical protein
VVDSGVISSVGGSILGQKSHHRNVKLAASVRFAENFDSCSEKYSSMLKKSRKAEQSLKLNCRDAYLQ